MIFSVVVIKEMWLLITEKNCYNHIERELGWLNLARKIIAHMMADFRTAHNQYGQYGMMDVFQH